MKKFIGYFAAQLAAVLAGFSGIAVAAGVPTYIEPRPLAQIVTTPVGDVRGSGPVTLPVITWGGDIATILANGNAPITAQGSIFASKGQSFTLKREDVFSKQVEMYMSGQTPYLRGTMGMVNMAAEVASRDPRTQPIVIYQHTFSVGGDALVVRESIKTAKDLCGKTIALQAYGPHLEYLNTVINSAGCTGGVKSVKLKWVKDLTGRSGQTPADALRSDPSVDAVFVISPDAAELSAGGRIGTGAEGSVRGARIFMSTKTANRVIADVYAVRADYYKANRDKVLQFVNALTLAEEKLKDTVRQKAARPADYKAVFQASAKILLDSEQAIADAEGLYADCEFVGLAGNIAFFANPQNPRSFDNIKSEVQGALVALGMLSRSVAVAQAGLDYNAIRAGAVAAQAAAPVVERFNRDQVAQLAQQSDKVASGELFSFEVRFTPEQSDFPAAQYAQAFERVVDLASKFGGAIISVEGHSDPLGYLRVKKEGQPQTVLKQTETAAKNLSLSRANKVRDGVMAHARAKGVTLDPSQFAVVGQGIWKPKNGVEASGLPKAPTTEVEWQANMRVEFRIIQIEAESKAFKPL